MIINKNNFLLVLLFGLYSCLGLVPNYGAIDRVITQWLCLSVVNLGGLLYLLNDLKKFNTSINKAIRFKPLILLLIFVLWGLSTYLYAYNQVDVLVKFFRWINVVFALFICTTLVNHNKNSLIIISFIFSVILILELYFSYFTYFQIINLTNYDFSFSTLIRGSAANKNITAASILIKTPFIFYIFGKYKNTFIRFCSLLIIGFSVYMVLLLSARSSYISLILLLSAIIIFKSIQYIKNKKVKILKNTFVIFIPIFLSFILFQIKYGDKNSASVLNRVSQINTDDKSTQQRVRFYFHAVDQIKENPILGVGMGNWKIKSIDYDKKDIEGYIVPYHTHNDFLEFGAEMGIFGLLIYLGIFISLAKLVITKIRHQIFKTETFPLELVLLIAGLIYFVDANLNFPHARVVMQLPFIIYIALSIRLLKYNEDAME